MNNKEHELFKILLIEDNEGDVIQSEGHISDLSNQITIRRRI